eukprot:9498132-Pyramimonas_sp.AAC.1
MVYGSPHALADRELVAWRKVWQHHLHHSPVRPDDFASWARLPAIPVAALRLAALAFPERTAVGQTGIAPRALWHVSDEGLEV